MKRASQLAAVLALAVLLAACGGFAWFLHRVAEPAPIPSHADAIAAFSGGPDRVETALRLLADGRADRLLLSGIGGGANLTELAHLAELDPRPLAARVSIGRDATTTRGNALETAAWARANAIHTLLVVTASYHMPRALAELGRALPDVTLYPVPVAPHEGGLPLRLAAEEYVKFLAAETGLSTLLQPRGHAG
jgi:uncharacterized SAM-binding protein YcdF (DUF218 family)